MIVKCECEAVYGQIEIAVAQRIETTFDCKICGHELRTWHGNVFLSFELIKNPTG